MRKIRISLEPTGFAVHPYVFVVRFPGKGWKTRQYLTWNEALHAAGLIPFEAIFDAR